MIKKIFFLILTSILIYSCKTTETITLPEQIIEIDDPNKVPSRPVYNASNTKNFDLLHTKLAVRFNWEKAHMYGKAEITLVPHFYTQNNLILDARGMDLHKIQLISKKDGSKAYEDLNYTYENDKINITLSTPYTKTDTLNVFIDYTSKPNELTEGGSAAIKSDKGLYFINEKGEDKNKPMQIWTQGETQSNSAWFPTIDSPNQKSTEEIAITVNEKYKTLSNGVLSHSEVNGDGTRTDFWEQNMKHAPYLFMMTIGEFEIYKDTWRDIEVNYYVEKEYAPYAKDMFGLTPEMLEFYSNKLGVDYPWQKYSQVIVRDYVSGAMENTSAVIFGEFTHQTKRDMIDGSSGEDVIAHELFHHWFGDLVTCESWANLPLNESFATYGEFLWREHKYGDDKAAEGLQSDLNAYLNEVSKGNFKDMVRFDFKNREDMFDRHTYQKGGRILHMLRNYMGDEAFFASLKSYLETNQYTDVEMHQLRLACEKITGEDLNWFFNQWFFAKGHPELNINYAYNDSAKTQTVIVEQMQDLKIAPLYYLPVNIDIYTDGKVKTHSVVIDKLTNEFTFNVASEPDLVNFDSDKMLLCEKIDNHKNIEEWAFMYNNAPRYLDRYEAIQKLAKSDDIIATQTMLNALNDKYPYLKRVAIRSIKKTVNSNKEEVKKQLLSLANNDKDSKVRGDALSTLAKYFKDDEAVKKALVDGASEESYYVIASALEGLSSVSFEDAMKFAESFETEKNNDIQNSIGRIYAMHGGKKHNQYFVNKINNTQGYGLYSLVTNYGKYLKNQDNETITKALPLVKKVALKEETWWIRLTGINAVADLNEMYNNRIKIAELELKELKAGDSRELELRNAIKKDNEVNTQVDNILDEIKQSEKHPRLRQMMGLTD
ncbi:MAG: M1 family metallopeptidase [Vicingaceae bacterium]